MNALVVAVRSIKTVAEGKHKKVTLKVPLRALF